MTRFADIDPSPRKTWLVERILGDGELSCIFGPPGSGKSALATDLATHIAAGMPWLGRSVKAGAALYVAAERAPLVKRRMAAWQKHHSITDLPLAVLDGTIDLRTSKRTAAEIINHAKLFQSTVGRPVRLIVVDTVSRALAGGDENSSKDLGALIMNVTEIQAATGAAVSLVHHVPQDGQQRLRGHGVLLGAVDTTVSVTKSGSIRTARVEKANDSEEGESVTFALTGVKIAEDGTTAPVVVAAGPLPETRYGSRRLPEKARSSLSVLAEVCITGKPLDSGQDSSSAAGAVQVDAWHQELFRRGILKQDHSNPREDFRRVKSRLLREGLAEERDGWIRHIPAK